MKAIAIQTLEDNATLVAIEYETTAKEIVKEWLNDKETIERLISDYQHDYEMMLEDFGAEDIDVINYKHTIEYLQTL